MSVDQEIWYEDEEVVGYGKWIRAARVRAGLTMRDAARQAGLSEDGLGKVERDDNGASLRTLETLSKIYGVEIGDLLPHSPEMGALNGLANVMAQIPIEMRHRLISSFLEQARVVEDAYAISEEDQAPGEDR